MICNKSQTNCWYLFLTQTCCNIYIRKETKNKDCVNQIHVPILWKKNNISANISIVITISTIFSFFIHDTSNFIVLVKHQHLDNFNMRNEGDPRKPFGWPKNKCVPFLQVCKTCISDWISKLQELVPNMDKLKKALNHWIK